MSPLWMRIYVLRNYFIIKQDNCMTDSIRLSFIDGPVAHSIQSSEEPHRPAILRPRSRQSLQHSGIAPTYVNVDRLINKENQFEGVGGRSDDVRQNIDKCVNVMMRVHEAKMQKRKVQITTAEPLKQDRVVNILDDAVHSIDKRLVLDYIQTVQRDYGFRDRFTQAKQAASHHHGLPLNIKLSTVQPTYSEFKKKSEQKQSQKKEARPFLSLSLRQQNDLRRRESQKREASLYKILQNPDSPLEDLSMSWNAQSTSEQFCYCIACEKPVLIANSVQHEETECPNLKKIYCMNIRDVKLLVNSKITRIKQELRRDIAQLSTENKVEALLSNVLANISAYLDETEAERFPFNAKCTFSEVQHSMQNTYMNVLQNTHKLAWFLSSYINLSQSQNMQEERVRKSELGETFERTRDFVDGSQSSRKLKRTLQLPTTKKPTNISVFEVDDK